MLVWVLGFGEEAVAGFNFIGFGEAIDAQCGVEVGCHALLYDSRPRRGACQNILQHIAFFLGASNPGA